MATGTAAKKASSFELGLPSAVLAVLTKVGTGGFSCPKCNDDISDIAVTGDDGSIDYYFCVRCNKEVKSTKPASHDV